MNIDTKFLEVECQLLKQEILDERIYNHLCKSKTAHAFFFHERLLNRNINKDNLKCILDKWYLQRNNAKEDFYGIRNIHENIDRITEIIYYLKKEAEQLNKKITERLAKYTDSKVHKNITVHLYGLGYDGGFALVGNNIYINMALLIKFDNELEDIIAHEIYHIRKKRYKGLLRRYFFNIQSYNKNNYKEKMYYEIAEEGIATLIEFNELKESSHMLSSEKIENAEKYLSEFEELIKSIHNEKVSLKELIVFYQNNNLSYVIGYHVAKKIFNVYGKNGLDVWSIHNNLEDYLNLYKSTCS